MAYKPRRVFVLRGGFPRSASDRNCPPASTMCLTIANRSKVERTRQSMRETCHHVARAKRVLDAAKLRSVCFGSARHLAGRFFGSGSGQGRKMRTNSWVLSAKPSMSGHPRNVRQSWAEDVKPDKMIVGRESGSAPDAGGTRAGCATSGK